MSFQVAAHGFEMTDGLKTACETETKDKLQQLALHNFSAKWVLTVEKNDHKAHVSWSDGSFRGDVSVATADMYKTISQCTKKAAEQMKKAHQKKNSHKVQATKTVGVEQVMAESPEEEVAE